jgi:plastocyanin
LGSALASGTIFGASAPPVNVRGKVTGWEKLVPQVYADTAADPHRYTWREPSPTVKQEFRKLSANVSRDVCVVATTTAAATAHEALAVRLTGGRLTPSTIVLSPGSRLSFKNLDSFSHILYEVGNDKWAANTTASGSNREWAATTPGLHVIRDELFPSVVMYVTVDPGAVEFATPDHDGAFSMAVAPGDYTVKVFFEGKQVGKSADPVHVGPGGLDLNTLALGAPAGESK